MQSMRKLMRKLMWKLMQTMLQQEAVLSNESLSLDHLVPKAPSILSAKHALSKR